MNLILSIVGWTVFAAAILVAMALNLVGLFGNWIILSAVALAGLAGGFTHFGGWTLPILLVLAIVAEVLEMAAAGVGAARFGGGRGAIIASLVGCLLGAAFGTTVFPIIGTLIGACLGAFLAAFLYEYLMTDKDVAQASRVGMGAALGKVAGLFAKTFIGVAMLIVAAWNF